MKFQDRLVHLDSLSKTELLILTTFQSLLINFILNVYFKEMFTASPNSKCSVLQDYDLLSHAALTSSTLIPYDNYP